MKRLVLFIAAGVIAALPRATVAQIPDSFSNLQVLDADITRDSLLQVMRGFAFALGARCEHCHVTGPNGSFQGADFSLDEKLPKRRARFMLRLVDQLNGSIQTGLPMDAGSAAPVRVECKTCHRGRNKPLLLKHELQLAYDEGGVEAAEARYRTLRDEMGMAGAFDFGQWEFNEWARRLEVTADGIAMLELNFEFHPESSSIASMLSGGYEQEGDLEAALEWMNRAVELAPENPFARRQLERLRGLREGSEGG